MQNEIETDSLISTMMAIDAKVSWSGRLDHGTQTLPEHSRIFLKIDRQHTEGTSTSSLPPLPPDCAI